MLLGFVLMVAVYWIFHRVSVRYDRPRISRGPIVFGGCIFSLGHGGNDAQKTMGIITIVLVAGGFLQMGPGGKLPDIPRWVEICRLCGDRSRHTLRRLAYRQNDGHEDR